MHYLAIDPGLSSGIATFDAAGKVTDISIIRTPAAMFDFLSKVTNEVTKLIIVEEFKLFQRKALQQSGSDMVASRVIGAIEYVAHSQKIPIVWQPAQIKRVAEMWTGKKPPSNHNESHGIDAYNHGMYYLIKNKVITPK